MSTASTASAAELRDRRTQEADPHQRRLAEVLGCEQQLTAARERAAMSATRGHPDREMEALPEECRVVITTCS